MGIISGFPSVSIRGNTFVNWLFHILFHLNLFLLFDGIFTKPTIGFNAQTAAYPAYVT